MDRARRGTPRSHRTGHAGDAPEIDHYEVIWNSIHGILNDFQALEESHRRGNSSSSSSSSIDCGNSLQTEINSMRSLLIRLRQISCAIYDQEHNKDWYDIVQDIDLILNGNYTQNNKQQNVNGLNHTKLMETAIVGKSTNRVKFNSGSHLMDNSNLSRVVNQDNVAISKQNNNIHENGKSSNSSDNTNKNTTTTKPNILDHALHPPATPGIPRENK